MADLHDVSYDELVDEIKKRRLTKLSTEDLLAEFMKRKEQADGDGLKVESIPNKINIEALLDDEELISPSIEVEVGNVKRNVCFRKISRQQMEKREAAAEGYIHKGNERVGLPYEHINSPLSQERLAAEKELRLVHCAMVDPDSTGKHAPAYDLAFLRENLTHFQQTKIYNQWLTWHMKEVDNDPLTMNEEQLDETIEAIKKNDVLYLINVGYNRLVSCVLFLASKVPEDSLTNKSLDI